LAAKLHITCNNKVLFPAPGEPPMSIAEPGTTPPPNTRSSSLKPEVKRGKAAKSMFPSVSMCPAVWPEYPPELRPPEELAAETTNSVMVFQALQSLHCPCQRGYSAPQSEHTNAIFRFAIFYLF
ncbi:MAG: hypothetical protein ACI88A_004571, partial [Paraglaciecola sp.]